MIRVAVLIISEKGVSRDYEDKSGNIIAEMVKEINGEEVFKNTVDDEFRKIQEELFNLTERGIADLILTTGGTGFARRDVTPEATMAVIERETPGISEMMRWKAGQRTPKAALTRARAGIRKSTLIVNLPGSPKAVCECLDAILPVLPHGVEIIKKDYSEQRYHEMQLWDVF
ncbi:MAG: MogA/MoaB family molybdenum cofactor biosynthesis protein [Halanaerobiales bacterium]